MGLVPGSRLGPYEIVSLLGAGGMGEVYRGRDTRLDRTVAIKVLAAHVSGDPDLRQRFEREARAISSLNHPHICTLHDVGSHDGVDFLVMEFLDGQTLADRLSRGPLEIDSALRCGVEIAEALDRAHRQGIVHRDLKPSNIMLTKGGVKLLDFGLAKLKPQSGAFLDGVTQTTPVTNRGTILGTLPYMAPEQLEGKDADARTDIFAFGAVLHEIATGKRAFEGTSHASLISAIMSSEPPALITLQPLAPPALERVVKKCLNKDPDHRWQTARDLADELRWIGGSSDAATSHGPTIAHRPKPAWVPWAIAGLSGLVALGLGVFHLRQPAAPQQDTARFALALPESASARGVDIRSDITTSLAVSPNGRYLVLQVMSDGRSRLWLRALNDTRYQELPGTEGAFSPFWSPDSRFIGFGAQGKLKKIEVNGGSPLVICDAAVEGVPTWNQFGTILFADDVGTRRGIMSVSADGGTPAPITKVEDAVFTHLWPHFLPDGQHFLYLDQIRLGQQIYVGSLDGAEPKAVAQITSRVEYARSGHLLYVNDGTLLAQRFDPTTFQVAGEPTPIADGIRYFKPTGAAGFSVSEAGVLAYEHVLDRSPQLAWFDRTGNMLNTFSMPGPIKSLRLSSDGQRFAVDIVDQRTGMSDIWVQEVDEGAPRRLTYRDSDDVSPLWSSDGARVIFRSDSAGPPDIHQKALEGAGNEEVVLASRGVQHPLDVSPRNERLIYLEEDRITRSDLWILPLTGDRTPTPWLRTPFEERDAVFSPDGRSIAFESDESGAPEVYVTPINAVGSRRRISIAGGQTPRWRRDGRELFYLSPNAVVMSVAIASSPTFQVGPARQLFSIAARVANNVYDVSPDGQRLLVNIAKDDERTPVTVVLDWTSGLNR